MKVSFLFFCFILSSEAEVSRRPAVEEKCDAKTAVDVDIYKTLGEKVFDGMTIHQVIVRSDDEVGCSVLPNKRYADSVYEENARNEMQILFNKYFESYSKECNKHFSKLGLKFKCKIPEIVSMTFSGQTCEKKIEDGTGKISHASVAVAEIKYKQIGWQLEEKLTAVVQEEICARFKSCMGQASEEEMQELKKLSNVPCNSKPLDSPSLKSPTIQRVPGFDGNRNSEKTNGLEEPGSKKLEQNKGKEI